MTDAPLGNVVYGTLRATLPMPRASVTGTVRAMVQATAEVVRAPETALADLRALVVELQTTVREMERQHAAAAAAAQAPGLALATYRWTAAGSLAGWISVLIGLIGLVLVAIDQARPDPPPNVTVVAPQPNITVIVPPAPTPEPDDDSDR